MDPPWSERYGPGRWIDGRAASRPNEWGVAPGAGGPVGSGHNRNPDGTSFRSKCNDAERGCEPSRDECFAAREGQQTGCLVHSSRRGTATNDLPRTPSADAHRRKSDGRSTYLDGGPAADGPWTLRPPESLRRWPDLHHPARHAGHPDHLRLLLPLLRPGPDRGWRLWSVGSNLLVVCARGDRRLPGQLTGLDRTIAQPVVAGSSAEGVSSWTTRFAGRRPWS